MWGSLPADLAQGLLTVDHTGHRVAPATQGGVEPMARHWVVFRDRHAKTLSRRTELMYRHISGIGQKSDDLNTEAQDSAADQVEAALREVDRCGLSRHPERAKNWDAVSAVRTILERTDRGARILGVGARSYSVAATASSDGSATGWISRSSASRWYAKSPPDSSASFTADIPRRQEVCGD